MLKPLSSRSTPPTSSALISPPNSDPETSTPSEEMPTIGNWPASRSAGSIWMPCTVPEKLRPESPCRPVTRRRQGEGEVGGVLLDVGPLDADRLDLDRQEARPLERAPGGRADAEEDAEAGLGDEAAVAGEGEVLGLPADLERADLDRGADRGEGDEVLIGAGVEVEVEVARRERQEAAQADRQRVDVSDEVGDLPVREHERQPHRFGIDGAVGVELGAAVGDRGGHRLARQQRGPAGGEEDRAVERRLRPVEVDREVLHARSGGR